ncbi:MAG: sensor histidine kinase [Acidobacteria bacterium]|nr:sensor histidine kinase [Acidobacteriota bacterium]
MRVRQLIQARPGRHLVLVFTLTILLPGLVLAIVGVRALIQERALAAQEMRERLDRSAALAAQQLGRELQTWRTLLDAVGRTGTIDPGALPDWLRESAAEPGAAALVAAGPDGVRVWPRDALAYQPWPELTAAPRPPALPRPLAEAERVELGDKDYPRAISLYQNLFAQAAGDQRAWLLHRLARVYRKAGRANEARRTFETLAARTTDHVGALPADLVARYELSSDEAAARHANRAPARALALYRDLVGGSWPLEKTRYLYYADTARAWAAAGRPPSEEVIRLSTLDEAKRGLAEAFVLDAGVGGFVIMSRPTNGAPRAPRIALAVATRWLQAHRWPDLFAALAVDGLDVGLVASNGDVLYGEPPATTSAGVPLAASRPVQEGRLSWRVEVRPAHADAWSANLARRRTVFVTMLIAVLALMSFGTYLTLRVVRREVEIARMKSDFVSTVSHEFRSPLTAIRQLGEMLMRGRVPNEARRQEYYERITSESDRLARLVENVLDFSRMDEGRRPYALVPIDTSAWLNELAARFEAHASQNGHQLITDIPARLPELLADREALSTALDNLLDNAVKYSPAPAAVWLDANARDGGVTIRVRDRGIGIAPVDQPHIFDRFYRGTDGTAREVKGTGLGLSLVQHIVQAHGGCVTFESRSGEGTTFSVHLKGASIP